MAEPPPLRRRDIDDLPCANPSCDHSSHDGPMVLSGACHKEAPVFATYHAGVLRLRCSRCRKPVVHLEVAP